MLSGRLHDSGIDKFRLIRGIGTADIETSDAEFCRGLIGRISGCGKGGGALASDTGLYIMPYLYI
jgi:hypothetical protein